MQVPNLENCTEVARILKQLAHPQRLNILCQLALGTKNVPELEKASGASQSSVSQFLSRMKADGLVDCRRENRSVYYRIKDERVTQLLKNMYMTFCAQDIANPSNNLPEESEKSISSM